MPLLAEGLARGMTDDVLTKEMLEDAMQEMAMIQPYEGNLRWIGPKWATDILMAHWPGCLQGDHTAKCDDCTRAWRVMAR